MEKQMKVVIDQDGDAVILNRNIIKQISRLNKTDDSFYFDIAYIDNTKSYFTFDFENFKDEVDILEKKVDKIRKDIIEYLNYGVTPEQLLSTITLVKHETISEEKE